MPEVAVVDDHDDDRQVLEHGRRELLAGHLEAAVAVDADDGRVGPGRLRADRGRDAVAHRPEPARGDERARPVAERGTASPTSGAGRRRSSRSRRRGRRSAPAASRARVCGLSCRRRCRSAAGTRRARPRAGGATARCRRAVSSRRSSSARSARICFSGPTTGTSARRSLPISAASMSRWTTVAPGAKRVELAGDAVVEARADRDEQVALVHRPVRPLRAVHAGPAEVELVRLREGALRHQRRHDREPAESRRARAARRRRRR